MLDYLLLPSQSILHSAGRGSDSGVAEYDVVDGAELFGRSDNAMQQDFAA